MIVDPAMLNTLPSSPNILLPSPDGNVSSGKGPGVSPPNMGISPPDMGVRSRPRGAQPLNHNALRHGLYAHRSPTPLTHFVKTIHVSLPSLEAFPAVLEEALLSLRLEMARLFASQVPSKDLRIVLAQQRPILHLLGLFIRTHKILFRLRQPQSLLQLVAAHALPLIRYGFRSNGITRDAYSFREKRKLSDFNSLPGNNLPPASSLLFLTARQCQLLEPLLPSFSCSPLRTEGCRESKLHSSDCDLQSGEGPGVGPGVLPPEIVAKTSSPPRFGEGPGERSEPPGIVPPDMGLRSTPLRAGGYRESKLPSPDCDLQSGEGTGVGPGVLPPDMGLRFSPPRLGEGPGVRSGRPSADPLPLLDAILWKLSHHALWQDLPPSAPPMLTCRRYYRRLYLSGRLLTLISTLFKDFLATSRTDLPSLVTHGCFVISGNRLALQPGLEESWQTRSAFLFMQLGWQTLRRLQREKKL